jgi:peptidyl-prolyl cis-trans isomerase C
MKLTIGPVLAAMVLAAVVAGGGVYLWMQNRQSAPVAQQATPAAPQSPAAEAKAGDVVVAVVNGQKVMRSEIELAMSELPAQYRQYPMQLIFPALLDQVISSKLLAAEGRKQNLQNDADVKRRMATLEDQLIRSAYLQKEIEKQLTPEAVRARYDKQVTGLPAEEEVQARHILVKGEDEAKAIIAELKANGDFAKIAKEKSTDQGSGANGGELGWFKKGDMVPEFAEAAFTLKKGEVSPAPVKTQFGFHVIKLEDRRQAKPPAFEEMEEELRQEMAREAGTQMIEQLRAKAQIERFNMDGSKIVEEQKPAESKPPENKPAGSETTPAEKK